MNNNTTAAMIKHVKGNFLRLAIPLTIITKTTDGGQETSITEDFIPNLNYPITVRLGGSYLSYSFDATMDGNIAIMEDNGTLPKGVYQVEVLCKDDNGNNCRFMQRNVIDVVDATIEAGIVIGTEFEVETHYLDAAVFIRGEKGDKGDKGDTGEGVPSGGTTGQVLQKKSDTDYDTWWVNPPGVNRESLTVTATANQGSVSDAVLTVKVDGQTIVTDTGSLSVEIDYGVQYTIEAGAVSGYETPQSQTFTAGQPTRVVLMTYTYIVIPKETLNVTATASTGDVSSDAVITVKSNGQTLATGTGSVTVDIDYDVVYSIECSRVYDYLTPATQTFTAGQSVRNVTMAYTYIARDTITINQTVSNELSMISGDVQGDVIKAIRAASHLYLGTQTETGNQLICQLSDTDGTKYHDGTTAAMNGTDGDQWLKLPVFWWKVTGIGTPDANDTYDQYSFSFAFAGEPDSTWHKWEGDMNLLGAKKMYVTGNKGYSRSGIQGSANFTQAQGNSYAAARGTGYSCVTWEWQWMMCVLFYAWYGRMNSQAQCGYGSNIKTRTLGTKDSLGMTDTTSANGNSDNTKFWGIENWWGDLTEWIGNITSQDYVVTIVDMNTKQSRTVSGWYQFGGTGDYASRFKVTDLLDFIPRAKNGTETTCYCDWVNGNTGSRVLNRSGSFAGAGGGVADVNAVSAPSGANAAIGSRLAFNGVITEAESVAAYKAALA